VWSISSDEKFVSENHFNEECSKIMETLQSDEINKKSIEEKIKKYSKTTHGKLFIDGVKVFIDIQNIVKYQKALEFTELAEEVPEFNKFFNYFASTRSINKEMLFPSFLASDIIVYIFNHRDIVNIHIEDSILSNKDEKCLSRYYELAFSIFDYQKNLFSNHFEIKDFYHNTPTFDLLALALYSKAIVATKGKNYKHKINELIQTIDENKFKVGSEKNRWYNWIEKDLKAIKNRTFTRYKISNRVPVVRGRWLI
jgi:hypothetical protein